MPSCRRWILLLLFAVSAHGQEPAGSPAWPQWRGGLANGCSSAVELPANLEPSGPTQRWRVPIPGAGISSPIVVGDRVFLTTAHPYLGGWLRLKSILIASLSLLILSAGGARVFWPKAKVPATESAEREKGIWLIWTDAAVVTLLSCAFVLLTLLATFMPSVLWTLGRPGQAWFVSGAIALVGLAAAGGWSRPSSILRPVGSCMLVVVAGLLWLGVPLDRYGIEHGALPRAMMVAPGLLFAVWSSGLWILVRGRGRRLRTETRLVEPKVHHLGLPTMPRVALGLGRAAMVVSALTLFGSVNTWERDDQLARSLLCLDLKTGEILWQRVLLVGPKEPKWPANSYATPTPCSDGHHVFAYFGVGWACVSLEGEILWQGVDPDYAPNSRYGTGASPILDSGRVLLWQENEMQNRSSYLLSLDLASGERLWRVEIDDVHDSYSTPIIVRRADGSRELVSVAYRKLVAHSLSDGARLWELPLPLRQVVPSLCDAGGGLLLVSGGTHLEFSTSGVRLRGFGAQTSPEVVWQSRRNLSDICSPVMINDLYFTMIDGRMRCIDPKTGDIHWTGRVGAIDYWSSLVAGDDKVYTLSSDGVLTTVAVDASEFRVLSESDFGEECMATPALAEGYVLVRTKNFLYCFGSS